MIHVRIISAAQQIIYGHVEVVGKSENCIKAWLLVDVFKVSYGGLGRMNLFCERIHCQVVGNSQGFDSCSKDRRFKGKEKNIKSPLDSIQTEYYNVDVFKLNTFERKEKS